MSTAEITRRRAGHAVIVFAAALALVGAAWGGQSGASSSNGASPAGASSAAASDVPPAVFRVGFGSKVTSLDPDLALQNDALMLINLIGGTLTQFTPDASAIRPGLASKWTISPNAKTYTFTLRSNLKFSTGSPLAASDVVATFNRYMTDKANAWGGLFASIATVSAPDTRTVVIKLKAPQSSLLQLLAEPVFMISPAAGIKQPKTFYRNPISAGPYKVKSFSPGRSAVLERNPTYYGRAPSVKQLDFTYIGDTTSRIVQLRGGALDLAENIPPNAIGQLTGAVTAVTTPLYGGWYFYVNTRKGALADAKVRRAISLAVDRDQLNKTVWNGDATPLYGFYPTTMRAWHQGTLPKGPDVDAAKALLAGTACENGCTIDLIVRTDAAYYADMATVVQQNLRAVGINLNLQQTDASDADQKEFAGKFELAIGGLTDYTTIPDGFLTYGLRSDGGIFALFSGYKSAKMDGFIQTVLSTRGAKQASANREINRLYAKDMPSIPLLNWPWVNGQRRDTVKWVKPEPSAFLYVAPAP